VFLLVGENPDGEVCPVPDDPKPTENKQASKEPAETEEILEQLRKSGESVLASQPTPPEASKAVPKVPTTKISLSPTEELTAHPPKPGFVRYYWTCLKHFGSRVWETKGAELVSGIVLAFAAFGASLLFSEEGADRAFEIALVSLAGWLAVFALGHLIRTPWLVHRDMEAATKIHRGFGILGVVVVGLMAAGFVAGGLQVHSMLEPRIVFPSIKFPSADLGAKDAQIKQLTQQLAAKPRTITVGGPPVPQTRQCWLSNHFGMPNSTIKGAVTATAAILHCNTKTDAPFRVAVEFDKDFIPGAMTLPDVGIVMGIGQEKQGNVYVGQVGSPALLSEQLIVVTVYGTTDQYPRALRASVEALK
jgi:hypothetical protein